MSALPALGWTLIIVALLTLAGACFAAAWWVGRRALAVSLDAAKLPPVDPDCRLLLPPALPTAGLFPMDSQAMEAIRWSELRVQQDRMARDVADQTAATVAEIRALTAEAEQRIPARWRHQPPPRSS